ncbi:MAG: ABC transporter permease [Rhodobacterales bacterium]|nr:ABC transporter permease [Rhodobacterales bacterium]
MSSATILRAVLSQPSGAIGVTLVVGHVLLAVLSPLVLPHDPVAQSAELILQAPSLSHPFGTDRLGRDILSRTMLGGREAMLIATLATLVAMVWGATVGLFLALIGGRTDAYAMRIVDALSSIPGILIVMIFVAALGVGVTALIPILGFSYGLSVVYIARAAALDFVARDFVLAAQARGEARATILIREILPNVRDSLAVQGAMQWSWLLLGIASLSFLGLGVAPPAPDWGLMIADGRGVMQTAPWAVLWPMAMLSSLIVGVNLAADAFSKALGVDRQMGVRAA